MIFEKVRAILGEQFDVDEDSITMETSLSDDLEADSLDLADLLASLEDEFNMEVSDDTIANIETVADIVSCISSASDLS